MRLQHNCGAARNTDGAKQEDTAYYQGTLARPKKKKGREKGTKRQEQAPLSFFSIAKPLDSQFYLQILKLTV